MTFQNRHSGPALTMACLTLAGAMAAGFLGGCTEAGQDRGVTDHAEVDDQRAIESHEPYLQGEDAIRVASDPDVVIGDEGGEESAEALYRVTFARVLSDGRIVLAHHFTPMIRWYSAEGEYLMGTGRPGGGPGEFGGGELAHIQQGWQLAGDSIATWEPGGRRMQVFDPDGRYARSVRLDFPATLPALYMVGTLGEGFVMRFEHPERIELPGGLWQSVFSYHRFRGDGSHSGPIVEGLPGHVRFLVRDVQEPRGGGVVTSEAFAPFAANGVALSAGDRFYYGARDRSEISVLDPTGALVRTIRWPGESRPFTQAEVARYRDWRHAEAHSVAAANPAAFDHVLDQTPLPDRLPAFGRIVVDRQGWLWIQRYPFPWERESTWWVFDHEGRWASTARLSAAARIHDIGHDYVLVVEPNDLGVQFVRRYRLHGRP